MNVNSKMNIGLNPNCKILINECWTKSSYNKCLKLNRSSAWSVKKNALNWTDQELYRLRIMLKIEPIKNLIV